MADQLAGALAFGPAAAVAEVGLLLRDLLEAVAGEMEAGVAGIAVKNLVGVVVVATEAYLAVGLEKLLYRSGLLAFYWLGESFVLYELGQLLFGFVEVALLEVF